MHQNAHQTESNDSKCAPVEHEPATRSAMSEGDTSVSTTHQCRLSELQKQLTALLDEPKLNRSALKECVRELNEQIDLHQADQDEDQDEDEGDPKWTN